MLGGRTGLDETAQPTPRHSGHAEFPTLDRPKRRNRAHCHSAIFHQLATMKVSRVWTPPKSTMFGPEKHGATLGNSWRVAWPDYDCERHVLALPGVAPGRPLVLSCRVTPLNCLATWRTLGCRVTYFEGNSTVVLSVCRSCARYGLDLVAPTV